MTNETFIIPESLNLRGDNPYSIGNILLITENDLELVRKPLAYIKSPKDSYYTTSANEDLSDISFKAYNSSKYWWIIYDVNTSLINNPFEVPANTVLLIPDLDTVLISNQ